MDFKANKLISRVDDEQEKFKICTVEKPSHEENIKKVEEEVKAHVKCPTKRGWWKNWQSQR